MACNFSIPFNGTAQEVYAKAQSAIQGQGGTFSGNEQSGSFSVSVMGTISGSYTITGQQIDVNIDSKPMFIPCSTIESFLKKQIA